LPIDGGIRVAEGECGGAVSEQQGERERLAARRGPDVRPGGGGGDRDESREGGAVRDPPAASRADARDVRHVVQRAIVRGRRRSFERQSSMTRAILTLLAAMPLAATDFSGPIDTLFKDYNQPGVPGASVIVIREGKVLYKHAYGLADVEAHTAA